MNNVVWLIFLILITTSCVNDPSTGQARYARDELYCWYKEPTRGKWIEHGLAAECPTDAPHGGPLSER